MRWVLVWQRTWRKPFYAMCKQPKKDVAKRHSIWESYMRQAMEYLKIINKQQSGMPKLPLFTTHQQKASAVPAC